MNSTESHYHRDGLLERIVEVMESKGLSPEHVTRRDLSMLDEFHVRGAQVSKELAESLDIKKKKVLDLGCGLGGSARMLADVYQCDVTGVDLSREFIRIAQALSKMTRLEQINFIVADATNCPFEDAHFDLVWTQHAQMNIEDKDALYQEISRLLKPGGQFLYYDILKTGTVAPSYPQPWSEDSSISHLQTSSDMSKRLEEHGLKAIEVKDQTTAGIKFFEKVLEHSAGNGLPELSLKLLMGDNALFKFLNLLEALDKGALILESGIYQKEG